MAVALTVAFSGSGVAASRTVRVFVARADASPVAGARVEAHGWETTAERRDRLTSTSPLHKPLAIGRTGADGWVAMRVPDLPVIAFDVEGDEIAARRVSVARGEDRVVVVASRAHPRRGKLVWSGTGQRGLTLVWLCDDGAEIVRRSGAGGELNLPTLVEPDRCSVEVLGTRWTLEEERCDPRFADCVLHLAEGRGFDGQVTTLDRRTPVAAATVTAGEWRRATSDGVGRFSLRSFVPGRGEMVARKGSLVGVRSEYPPGERIAVQQGVTVRGQVVDARSRQPVDGARVTVGRGGFESTLTAGDGSFELGPGVIRPHEEWVLEVEHPAYFPWWNNVRLGAGSPLVIEIEPALVTGVVRDETGRPVSGALVQCRDSSSGSLSVPAADCGETIAGPDGRFRLFRRPHGYRGTNLGALKAGFAPARLELPVPQRGEAGAEPRTVAITMTRGVELSVQVEDETGRPVEGAEVAASSRVFPWGEPESGADDGSFAGRTDKTGRATLRLAPGSWSVAARASGFLASDAWCEVAPPAAVVSLRLLPAVGVNGRVMSADGAPVSGATVESPIGGPKAMTDAGGRFVLRGLETGVHQVLIDAGGVRTWRRVRAPAEDVTFMARPSGRVEGRVTDAATGKPIRRFQFRGESGEFFDPEGRFSLVPSWTGAQRLDVEAEGYQPGGIDVRVPEEGEVEANVALEPGCLVEGVVIGPDGPLRFGFNDFSLRVATAGDADHGSRSEAWSVYDDGSFSRWTVCGRLRMEVSHKRFRGVGLDVDTTTPGCHEIQLRPPLVVTGLVEDLDGRPIADATVSVPGPENGGPWARTTTQADGSFRLAEVPLDRFAVVAEAKGFEQSRIDDVDGSRDLRFRLARREAPAPAAVLTVRFVEPVRGVGAGWVKADKDERQVASCIFGTGSQRCRLELPVAGTITLRSTAVRHDPETSFRGWFRTELLTVEVKAGEEKEVDFHFGSIWIEPSVTLRGEGLPFALLAFSSLDPARRDKGEARAGAEGAVGRLGPLLPGTYEFVVDARELAGSYRLTREIRQSGLLELDLHPVVLRGTVRDAAGLPVRGAVVDLTVSGAKEARRVVAGVTGGFRFFDVAPGPAHLVVSAAGLESRALDLDVATPDPPLVEVVLSRQ